MHDYISSVYHFFVYDVMKCFSYYCDYKQLFAQAAEALGAIGLESNIPLLKNSLVQDPAQEVRETCALALERIEQLSAVAPDNEAALTDKSPFMSVDPAAPASSCSSVEKLRFV